MVFVFIVDLRFYGNKYKALRKSVRIKLEESFTRL